MAPPPNPYCPSALVYRGYFLLLNIDVDGDTFFFPFMLMSMIS